MDLRSSPVRVHPHMTRHEAESPTETTPTCLTITSQNPLRRALRLPFPPFPRPPAPLPQATMYLLAVVR
ncbi:hypothetical protein CGRA01v4_03033 [Colletotrichum graminicola]|nr:hypothetical protein CGRA01v4_03033 [Colletotrichum graminicola]